MQTSKVNTKELADNLALATELQTSFFAEMEKQSNNFVKELEIYQKGKIKNLWININGYKDCNRRHYHPESIISGVFYVKAPDKSSILRFFHPSSYFFCRHTKYF